MRWETSLRMTARTAGLQPYKIAGRWRINKTTARNLAERYRPQKMGPEHAVRRRGVEWLMR